MPAPLAKGAAVLQWGRGAVAVHDSRGTLAAARLAPAAAVVRMAAGIVRMAGLRCWCCVHWGCCCAAGCSISTTAAHAHWVRPSPPGCYLLASRCCCGCCLRLPASVGAEPGCPLSSLPAYRTTAVMRALLQLPPCLHAATTALPPACPTSTGAQPGCAQGALDARGR